MRIKGNVTQVSRGIVQGWAADLDNLSSTLTVEVLIDGISIGKAVADQYRRDLDTRLSSGNHAFRLGIPPEFFDDRTHDVWARSLGTDELLGRTLSGIHLSSSDRPDIDCFVLECDGRYVRGVARNRASQDPLKVQLMLGDSVVATRLANQPNGSDTIGAFTIDLLKCWSPAFVTMPLTCRTADFGLALGGTVIAPLQDRLALTPPQCENRRVSSTVTLPACVPDSQPLVVLVDGQPLDNVTWDKSARPNSGVIERFFCAEIPDGVGTSSILSIRFTGTQLDLVTAPLALNSRKLLSVNGVVNGDLSRIHAKGPAGLTRRLLEVAPSWMLWIKDTDQTISTSIETLPGSVGNALAVTTEVVTFARLELEIDPTVVAYGSTSLLQFSAQQRVPAANKDRRPSFRRIALYRRSNLAGAGAHNHEGDEQLVVISKRLDIGSEPRLYNLRIPALAAMATPDRLKHDDQVICKFEFDSPLNLLISSVSVIAEKQEPTTAAESESARKASQLYMSPFSIGEAIEAEASEPAVEIPDSDICLMGTYVGKAPKDWRVCDDLYRVLGSFARLHRASSDQLQHTDLKPNSSAIRRAFRSELSFSTATAGSALWSDMWFANDATLRLRPRPDRSSHKLTASVTISAYQQCPRRRRLKQCGKALLGSEEFTTLDLTVNNPYTPLLLVISNERSTMMGALALPFPSLLRGGPHYAELCATRGDDDYPASALVYGNACAASLLGTLRSGLAITDVAVDISNCTGSEKVFSPWFRAWCNNILRVNLRADASLCGDAPTARTEYLCNAITGKVEREDTGARTTLIIPSGSIPTISSLVTAVPTETSRPVSNGGYIVANAVSHDPIGLISIPDAGAALWALQPAVGGTEIPFRTCEGAPLLQPGSHVRQVDSPWSINFIPAIKPTKGTDAAMLFPVAPDLVCDSMLRSGSRLDQLPTPMRLAAIVTCNGDTTALNLTLTSLASQRGVALSELILLIPANASIDTDATTRWAQLINASRFQVRRVDDAQITSEMNRAMADITDRHVALLSRHVILHNPLTLKTLIECTQSPNVATASCTLIIETESKTGSQLIVSTKGCYAAERSTHLAGAATELPETRGTYPVIANDLTCTVVQRHAWLAIGGLLIDTDESSDIDFGRRALLAGYLNINTGTVTALARATSSNSSTQIRTDESLNATYYRALHQ